MIHKKIKIKPLTLETVLTVIETSVGSKMFQSAFFLVGKDKKDILNKGDLSCAFFVSGVLAMFGLVDKVHATVSGTAKALETAGWQKTKKLVPGVVVVWDKPQDGSFDHQHIGFYLGDEVAISNNSKKGTPAKHHITFGKIGTPKYRPIIVMYKHKNLSK
ncbi:MAG: hypothetical protein QG665_442 [Patescibacteria group bacterium]|nr:hypothetical protein [Patescibacteria group bacterium]